MAVFRNRNGKQQARVQIKGHAVRSKTFINKVDAEDGTKSANFQYLTYLGIHSNLFHKQLKTRGRPPSGYAQPDLTDPKELALVILKIRPK